MLRNLPILLLVAACTGTPTVEPAEPVDIGPLQRAVAAHQAAPGPDTLLAVSKAAGALKDVPIGQLEVDSLLGDALCNHLLRPDLGLPRLDAHAGHWSTENADIWLDCLLRAGEDARLASELMRLHQRPIDPAIDGFRAATIQARAHRELNWRAAARAHDAGALVDAQHPRGRPLDRPLPDLAMAFDVFRRSFPDHRVHAAMTRSTQSERDDPMRDIGVIPVVGGRRRVLGYAADAGTLSELADQVQTHPPVRTLGVAIEAVAPDGRSTLRLCAEGRMESGQIWLLTACDEARELAWIEATELAVDAVRGGQSRESAVQRGADRFRAAVDQP